MLALRTLTNALSVVSATLLTTLESTNAGPGPRTPEWQGPEQRINDSYPGRIRGRSRHLARAGAARGQAYTEV